jgi:hypothetical protein
MAERPGFGGWGSRSTYPYLTAAPIKRKSAISDYPLFLGIGRKACEQGHDTRALQARRAFYHAE